MQTLLRMHTRDRGNETTTDLYKWRVDGPPHGGRAKALRAAARRLGAIPSLQDCLPTAAGDTPSRRSALPRGGKPPAIYTTHPA